jgi:hypothetical protein
MTDQPGSRRPSLIYTAPDILRRHWITEIDTEARRLKIARRWLGFRPKTIVDCSLDECETLGIMEYNHDGRTSFGAFFQLRNGYRLSLPLKDSTFARVSDTVAELSSATGISSVRLERQGS